MTHNRYNIGGDPIFDWNKNFIKFREYHNEVMNSAASDIHSYDIELDQTAEINASMMMMFKECRKLYKQEFYKDEDFLFIFYLMEISVDILIMILNEIEFTTAILIYQTFTHSLEKLQKKALKLELYEITENIINFREFFIDLTFDFDEKIFINKKR